MINSSNFSVMPIMSVDIVLLTHDVSCIVLLAGYDFALFCCILTVQRVNAGYDFTLSCILT